MNISMVQPLWELLVGSPAVVCGPLWFIFCLFSQQLMVALAYKLIRKWRWTCFALSVLFLLNSLSPLEYDFWYINWAFYYLPFYLVGNSLKRIYSSKSCSILLAKKGIFATLFCILSIVLFLFPPIVFLCYFPVSYLVNSNCLQQDWTQLVVIVSALGACGLSFSLSGLYLESFGQKKWVQQISSHPIEILGMQNYTIGFLFLILKKGEWDILDVEQPMNVFMRLLLGVVILFSSVCLTLWFYRLRDKVLLLIKNKKRNSD